MVEEGQLARRDLQYRLKLAKDEQIERLKAVIFLYVWHVTGCLQLLEILEILEISWNLKTLLEILEISWNLLDLLEIFV